MPPPPARPTGSTPRAWDPLPKSARAPTYLNYPRPGPEIAANAHNGSPLMLRYITYTAAARWPGQLLGRSTTRRLAALIPIQRGRHGLPATGTGMTPVSGTGGGLR